MLIEATSDWTATIEFEDDDLINLLSELDKVVLPLKYPPPFLTSLRRQLYLAFNGKEALEKAWEPNGN